VVGNLQFDTQHLERIKVNVTRSTAQMNKSRRPCIGHTYTTNKSFSSRV